MCLQSPAGHRRRHAERRRPPGCTCRECPVPPGGESPPGGAPALAATFDRTRFAALWFAARARRDVTRRARTARPSHANVDAARADGYVEGLRDAACALLCCDPADLFQALESACEGMDFYIARNRLVSVGPRMVLASHLGL